MRGSMANVERNGIWNFGSMTSSGGPTGKVMAQYAKAIVFSSIQGRCNNNIFENLDTNFPWQRPVTREDSAMSTDFSPRKFGTLWERVPSALEEIPTRDNNYIPVHDFFVIELTHCVIPMQITINQVVNPGAVTNIWVYNIAKLRWTRVWTSPPTNDNTKKSRALCISFNDRITFGTKFLRFELNHSLLRNRIQFGVIEVSGEKYVLGCSLKSLSTVITRNKYYALKALKREYEKCNAKAIITVNVDGLAEGTKLPLPERRTFENPAPQKRPAKALNLMDLPYELHMKIFSYLDLKTLFVVSSVCKQVYNLVMDPLLYKEVNLKMYWHLVDDAFLLRLAHRATSIRKLDISWCGWHGSVSPAIFMYFIRRCLQRVTHLCINACVFFTMECFTVMASVCEELQEISLTGYGQLFAKEMHFVFAAAKNLRKVDFFRTQIHPSVLDRLLRSSGRSLQHLGLGSSFTYDLDRVCRKIAKYNPEIRSLDFFQTRFLSLTGILELTKCPKLEEVDFSWSVDYLAYGRSLSKVEIHEVWETFFSSHKHLKKFFIAGMPKFDEECVGNMMQHCPRIQQIDLKNIRGFTSEFFPRLRAAFSDLQFFSISIRDPTYCPASEEPIDPGRRHTLPSHYITVARHFKPKP